jgi:hypothetical protein
MLIINKYGIFVKKLQYEFQKELANVVPFECKECM